MNMSVEKAMSHVVGNVPMSEASWSEQDRSLDFLRARFKRDRTYDNQTEEIQ